MFGQLNQTHRHPRNVRRSNNDLVLTRDLLTLAKSQAPWTEEKHRKLDAAFRSAAFGFLASYDMPHWETGLELPWDDVRRVLQAWSILRLRQFLQGLM